MYYAIRYNVGNLLDMFIILFVKLNIISKIKSFILGIFALNYITYQQCIRYVVAGNQNIHCTRLK